METTLGVLIVLAVIVGGAVIAGRIVLAVAASISGRSRLARIALVDAVIRAIMT